MSGKRTINIDKENETFPRRLRELMEANKITQEALASCLGIRRQTVSLYKSGQSKPDVDQLYKIARFFRVSSDYLIGISDIQSTDADVQQVCEFSGLSENVVNQLRDWKNSPRNKDGLYFTFLNHLFESKYFPLFLLRIYSFHDAVIAENMYQKIWDSYGMYDADTLPDQGEQLEIKFRQAIQALISDTSLPSEIREKLHFYHQLRGYDENQTLSDFQSEVLDVSIEMKALEELCVNRYLDYLLGEVQEEAEKYDDITDDFLRSSADRETSKEAGADGVD